MIEIVSTPPFNSVQDLGCDAFRKYGFGPGGAMDRVSLELANLLLGNAVHAACIEVQMFPLALRFGEPTRFAVTGSATATLDGVALPPCWTVRADAGQQLHIAAGSDDGARAYLALAGGIDVPSVLGSRSTRAEGFGGLDGRALRKGDVLRAGIPAARHVPPGGFGVVAPDDALGEAPMPGQAEPIRVLRAGEYEQLTLESRRSLWSSDFAVSARSNRQGYRFEGPVLSRSIETEMRSQPLVPGVMQLTPGGTIIVALSDMNAAGGYPRVGTVIDADLWKLGQMRPGQPVRFVDTSHADGLIALRQLRAYLDQVRTTVELWSASA